MSARRWLVVLAAVVVAAAIAVAWSSSTFVVTRGASMKPRISSGDLVVLRPRDTYRPGDVAGYRSPSLRRLVVHRIASEAPNGFTFRGDANAAPDPDVVPESAIVGVMAVRIPKAGAALFWLSRPFNAVLLLIALVLAVQRLRARSQSPELEADAGTPLDVWDSASWVTVSDLSFPEERALAELAASEELLRLAEEYGEPVLYDPVDASLLLIRPDTVFRAFLPPYEDQPET